MNILLKNSNKLKVSELVLILHISYIAAVVQLIGLEQFIYST